MVGERPTASSESEATHRPRSRRCSNSWIVHAGETPDIKERRECTTLQQNGPGNRVSNQQRTLPLEGNSLQ